MADASRVFPADEHRARVAALQEGMAADGLDALLLSTAADVFYVSGFLTRFWESPTRPWFVVVPASSAPIAVIPAIGETLMRRTWIADIRTWDAPDPVDDGVSLLVETLASVVPEQGRVGLPAGPETQVRMPLTDFRKLESGLAPRKFVDATGVVCRVREVKSEAEIDRIRATCAVADRAFARVPEIAAPGRSLADVFRGFQIALLEEGADWVSYLAGGAGPEGYSDVISPADNRPLATGNVMMLDTGAVRDGYFCDFDRNFAIGLPSDAASRAHAALHAATEAALSALRPGLQARDVHRLLVDGLRDNGALPCGGRLGHGLGLALTEWPSFTPKDETVLRAGMVLTLEPAAEVAPGRILVHEENLVLREHGAELLSARTPAELPVIGP
ncbi:Xaa-Pro peptidase family protein [Sulfitobacter sp. D35]|uniref:M24 family metallopeptidase n=1 Tax=Sulfitobacter sp. D35 TaxID=3083252 RepID=UPI00296EC64A|nr:Xaa-Pro peptidase family protein [Sulfitobacter sp. D35]MDW4497971.1 Xaa-Pro peptidase family protein [Sulfitobacter sp. D35]